MKKILLTALLVQACFVFGQVIPNPYFEGWNAKSTNVLKNWEVYGNNTKIAGKTGGSALRLTNSSSDGNAAYAYQSVFDTSGFFDRGPAFSFDNTPDSITITYRAALGLDTAYMQVAFTKSTETFPLTYNQYNLTNTGGAWKTVTYPVTYTNFTDSLKADSGWIYIQSADDFFGPFSNGYIDIDDITFIFKNRTTAGTMPNESFDNWDTYTLEQPDGWGTSALFLKNGGLHFNSTNKTTDKKSGSFGIKLQGFVTTDPSTLEKDTFPGFAITVKEGSMTSISDINIETPTVAVNQRFQSIRGYIKSNLQAGDRAIIQINFFKGDSVVGSAILSDTESHSSFVQFSEDIAWDSSFKATPDSATILLLVSDSTLENVASLNSWVIFDEMHLDNYSSKIIHFKSDELRASVFPNPSNGSITLKYNSEFNENAVVTIHSMHGQLVYSKTFSTTAGPTYLPIELENKTAGFYTITLQTSHGIFTEKIGITP